MEHITEYILFLTKILTIFIMLFLPLAAVLISKKSKIKESKIEIKKINTQVKQIKMSLEEVILEGKEYKRKRKEEKKIAKATTGKNYERNRTFICDFNGDINASGVNSLRQEISAILTVANKKDTIIVNLESTGGTMHGYGLGASQLQRIKEHQIKLIVTVDKVAASGGYLMACVANELIAAPFSIIGSIGVVAQIPNFNKLLKNKDIDVELLTAGQYKRTITMFGENSEEGREKFQDELNTAHEIFKSYIRENRPDLNIEKVATGEYWQATKALELGLIDKLGTSDDVVSQELERNDVFKISSPKKQSLVSKLLNSF